jgi:hypothetical protein
MRLAKQERACVEQLSRVMEILRRLHVIWLTTNVYVERIHAPQVKRVRLELACAEQTQLVVEIQRRMVAMGPLAYVEV